MEDALSKWGGGPGSQTGRHRAAETSVLPNLTYRHNMIPIKIPANFWGRYQQTDVKIYKGKSPGTAGTILKRRLKLGVETSVSRFIKLC